MRLETRGRLAKIDSISNNGVFYGKVREEIVEWIFIAI